MASHNFTALTSVVGHLLRYQIGIGDSAVSARNVMECVGSRCFYPPDRVGLALQAFKEKLRGERHSWKMLISL